ncbi:MAG: hypothetical protein DCF20_04650, partial [Pseudanabaena sp.]
LGVALRENSSMPSLILKREEEIDNIVIYILFSFCLFLFVYKFKFLDWFYYRTKHCKIATTPWVIKNFARFLL